MERNENQLLTFNRPVNVANKEKGGTESHCSKHKKEAIAYACHVSKEERSLHEARHI